MNVRVLDIVEEDGKNEWLAGEEVDAEDENWWKTMKERLNEKIGEKIRENSERNLWNLWKKSVKSVKKIEHHFEPLVTLKASRYQRRARNDLVDV